MSECLKGLWDFVCQIDLGGMKYTVEIVISGSGFSPIHCIIKLTKAFKCFNIFLTFHIVLGVF